MRGTRLQTWIVAAAAALAVWIPHRAWACASCMTGRDDETRTAFILTTLLMTVLPLGMLGGLFWWLRKRVREVEQGPARPVGGSHGPSLS